jgi:hypothetical protein
VNTISATGKREPEESEGKVEGTYWQWLAIGILVGCWLAEATWCIDRGF